MSEQKSLRIAYGEALVELAKQNDKVVVMDADLSQATMTNIFAKEFPEKFFDFGIAENNMVCAAAGFAHSGLMPFVSTFALFGAGRSFEMIRNSICYVNANVKFGFSHSGLSVGEDGGSHQSIEDIALMRVLPNMTVFVPCDAVEMKKAVFAAAKINGPVYIRVGRPVCDIITKEDDEFIPGKANLIKDGEDICIIATGLMVAEALKAAHELDNKGIKTAVANFHTIKPIDEEFIIKASKKYKAIITAEEHSVIGGLGSAVSEVLAGKSLVKFGMIGINDKFGQSGKPDELFKEYNITAGDIIKEAEHLLND